MDTRGRLRGLRLRVPAWGDALLVLVIAVGASYGVGRLYSDVSAKVAPTEFDAPMPAVNGIMINANFDMCGGGRRVTCVVDGDTLWVRGEKIRIADIDTPEVFSPKCSSERILGEQASQRLLTLVNAGPFELVQPGGRDRDVYGRELRVLMRNGRSLGDVLISEGLAHVWDGSKHGWCN